MRELGIKDLTPDQKEKLLYIFAYEELGPFVLARESPDEVPTAVYGDWNGDGHPYWETCGHCYLPIMESKGFKL